MLEHAPFILQLISAIIAPLLTGAIAWITNSLRKTNHRIDQLEKDFNETRLKDAEKLGELAKSISAMEATQRTISVSLNRIENYLMSHDK